MERLPIVSGITASLSRSRITVFVLMAVVAIAILGGWYAHRSSIAPVQNASIEKPAQPVASMRYLPTEVQRFLVSLCGGCVFADSNGSWNPTDVVDDRLPRRRLIRTERLGPEWHIEYEHGGMATFHYTVVVAATPQPRLLQGSSCLPGPSRRCQW